MADRLTLGPPRPWGSVVATPESPIKPEQMAAYRAAAEAKKAKAAAARKARREAKKAQG